MFYVTTLLIIAAFICCVLAAVKPERCPLWISVLLIIIAVAIFHLPSGPR